MASEPAVASDVDGAGAGGGVACSVWAKAGAAASINAIWAIVTIFDEIIVFSVAWTSRFVRLEEAIAMGIFGS
jgi:hypothetical protein